ncbi:cbb3-type cytochrome oxidase assembly protein CcoS [uncultured Halopseudomonas sp.]|uniref:cbb3-type cytochrome oxidase assembly protein CcoS n=1 Tax=uncultured Halopseudomonas sp. TaxID=2901193 RepID=UPI0030EF42EC|tara:strand:+ start:37746 stop:38000 length:255 start_codon:yes stop_codon:yes gene_type:complete
MTVLYILIPIAIVLVIIAIWVFTWAVNTGQYDDLDGPAHSILFDDEDPAHLEARKQIQEAGEDSSADLSDDQKETRDNPSEPRS